jgi:hypothetical protein
MLNFLLYLIPRAHNTASSQKNARPNETTQKNWYSVGSSSATESAWVHSKPVFRSVLDVHSCKGNQGEIRVYRWVRLTVLFNILEFGFRTEQKKRVLLTFYTNFINRLLNARVRNVVTLTLIFYFWPIFGREITLCTSNHVPKTVRNFRNNSPYLSRARTKRISAGDIVNYVRTNSWLL